MKGSQTYLNMFVAIAAIALGSSCQSPLSDVPISEPSVVRVVALVERDVYTTGGVAHTVEATLLDKHNEFIHLKEGSVKVNGLDMSYSWPRGYVRDDLQVVPDKDYTFNVTLADGSEYSCRAHTPLNLYELTIPAEYNRSTPFTVSWRSTDVTAVTRLDLRGDSATASFTLPSGDGTYSLQPTAFAQFHGSQTVHATLTLSKKGQVDAGFMSTSTADAVLSITRDFHLQ